MRNAPNGAARTRELRGARYLGPRHRWLADVITDELPFWDYKTASDHYQAFLDPLSRQVLDAAGLALLGCNDRFFLLTTLLARSDALHPWVFARTREVEAAPDGHLDLWSRYHFKSSVCTFAGIIQEVLCDPELTVAIFSFKADIAKAFLVQIKRELESNGCLQRLYPDVLWAAPRSDAPKWSESQGLIVKRRGNPKEATIEAHGLVDGQPTSRHYDLLVYDDVVTDKSVTSPEQILKTTAAWELSDNLGKHDGVRKWHVGTRYHFGDTYGVILERGVLKPRIHPATDDGTLNGSPVLLTPARWDEVKTAQRSTVSAQMLLNPIAGNEAVFRAQWFRPFEVRPLKLNVYIMCDPSKGSKTHRSDRTAIAVVGVDQGGNKYLLDGVRHRMKLSERWQYLKQLYTHWSDQPGVQLVRVGYERYGAQVDVEVISEWQERDHCPFEIEELGFPREGPHSKRDRVERLEPDMKRGKFHLPGVTWHPELGARDGRATWRVDEATGKILYRPLEGPTRRMAEVTRLQQSCRIMAPIRRLDENREPYDLTRCFIEEAIFFPFAPHDDLIDATSRIYDMSPTPADAYDGADHEASVHPD